MVAQAAQVTWFRRIVLWPLVAIAALIAMFFISAWMGSAIGRNGDWEESVSGVEIMIGSNGVHTEIVMPAVTAQKDWREDFPLEDLIAPSRPYTHVAVSWGEKEVFLNTPTWADLTLRTVLGAVWNGEGLLHVSHYVRPMPSPDYRTLTISTGEYAALVKEIERAVLPAASRRTYRGYGKQDVFYDAPGTYHFANTCNQWTSDTLAEAGIKTGWWTPLAGGVMKWVPEYAGI